MPIANRLFVLLSLLAILPRPSGANVSTGPVTLEDCYKQALRVSETLEMSEEEIRLVEAQYRQVVGSVLPHITWNMTQLWQDTSKVETSTTGVQGTLLRSRRPESFFQVQQPVFAGFREFNTARSLKAGTKAARFRVEEASLGLLVDVAEVFYISLDLQQELDVLAAQHKLTDDRLKELTRRVRLGRSRESETLSAEVELAALNALTEDTRQRWATARQTLYFLTEVPPNVPLADMAHTKPMPTIKEAHESSVQRPDILAAEQTLHQERFGIKAARAGYLPIVDFTGRYYTERVGFNEDVKWDALLGLEVPIFRGFRTRSEVQEARSREIIAQLDLARTKRVARTQIDTAHQNLVYALSQNAYYKKAVELADKNYKIQQEEYRYGLISNLEVLAVLNTLQDLKLRQLRVEATARLNDIRLRAAMGEGL